MCKHCYDVVHKVFPTETCDERNYILWNETCFPFGSPIRIILQLLEAKAARKVGKHIDMRTQRWVL